MLNTISTVIIFLMISVPIQLFGQDADSVVAAPAGISPEEVSGRLEALSDELTGKFSAREDSLKLLHESSLHSLLDSLSRKYSESYLLTVDSVRNAVTQELTDNFEKEKIELKSSMNSKMSLSHSSDTETGRNYYAFIKMLIELDEKDLFDDTIGEMDNFTKLFWSGELAEEIQLMMADKYEKKKMQFEALASYIKFIHLYPSSSKGDQARADLVSFISGKVDKSIVEKQSELSRIVGIPQLEKAYQDKYFAYIQTIFNLQIEKLNEWTLDEIKYYSGILPENERQPQISLWRAMLHDRLGDKKEASSFASKVIIGYPNSPLVPDALYLKATIQAEKLGKHEDAASTFLSVVDNYPTHPFAASALFKAATVQTEKLKDHSESVRTFRRLVDEYPDDSLAVDALLAGAKVLTDKVKDYKDARRFYHLITTKYPADARGGEAFYLAGNVAESKQKDIDGAIKDYIAVHEKYPDDLKAIELLIKAAQLQEKKKKDLSGSVNTLQIIVNKYPSYKDIGKIQKQIGKLKEKINKG